MVLEAGERVDLNTIDALKNALFNVGVLISIIPDGSGIALLDPLVCIGIPVLKCQDFINGLHHAHIFHGTLWF